MSESQKQALEIEALVSRRCDELGLSPKALIRRCGYKNVSKGLRRLEQLYVGDFKGSAGLIGMLPAALEVPVNVITKAVEETKRYLHESEEAAWRAAFRPHAVILTERVIPQPIFVAAFIGVDVLLRIDFDLTLEPGHFLEASPGRLACPTTTVASISEDRDRLRINDRVTPLALLAADHSRLDRIIARDAQMVGTDAI